MRNLTSAAFAVVALTAMGVSAPALAETAAQAATPTPAATPAPVYTTARTPLGTLLDAPAARAVLEKHLPELLESEQIEMARGLTLKALQQYAAEVVTDEKLAAIDADLQKLPSPVSPSGN